MKTRRIHPLSSILYLLTLCLCLTGCTAVPPGNAPTNPPAAVHTPARAWAKDILITFTAPPSTETIALLEAAGAKQKGGPTDRAFLIQNYSRQNNAHKAALEASLGEGASGIGLGPLPTP